MSVVTSLQIKVGGSALGTEQLRVLQSVEVENGVNRQAMFKLRLAVGQDASGDWAPNAESTFTPGTTISVEARIGENRRRLINGVLTEFKMNFHADPCQSQLELVGMDVLEKLKRKTTTRTHSSQSLGTIVKNVFDKHGIRAPDDVPERRLPNESRQRLMQAQNDLEFLRTLGDRLDCEVYVEPDGEENQGHFEPLALDGNTEKMPNALAINRGALAAVRNASFYYDLSQATVVEARLTGADGAASDTIKSDLRDRVGEHHKTMLGPSDFAKVEQLTRHGRETRDELQRLCDAALEKRSWVVVGTGELDATAYGDALIPRRAVDVGGVSGAFNGTYMVWKVTHSFTRDLYCQRFELRRKLAVRS